MLIVKLRRDGRALRRGSETWVTAATATRLMAEGRAAVIVDAAGITVHPEHTSEFAEADEPRAPQNNPSSTNELAVKGEASASPGTAAEEPTHLFMLSQALLAVQTSSGRRRLHRFAAQQDVCLGGDQQALAELLIRLGCASHSLPPSTERDTLVRFNEKSLVAGVRLDAGYAAALDFDPLSVLPELRGLGLYPWDVMPIENLGEDGCHGEDLEFVRLVILLAHSWHPMRTPGFLGGVHVDTTYRDYRRQLPAGQVIRAYATHGDHRPPHAVLGS